MLHHFVAVNRREIIARTRGKVALRSAPRPTARELETGVPLFLDQLVVALRGATPSESDLKAIGDSAAIHGGHLLEQGFTVSQVVHGYGDVCQAVTELAQEIDAAITTEEFHTLNRCLDDAIAEAVTTYGRLREQAITDQGITRSDQLAQEMRNRLGSASVGFELIRKGTVAVGGSVSALVSRNLERLGSLIHRSLVEVRLDAGIDYRERVPVAELIAEAEVDGTLEAMLRNQALMVAQIDRGVEVGIDRQIVAAALANLMRNAFRFTPPNGHVSLRTSATATRVVIDIEDECGGLPPAKAEELFGAFQLRGEKRGGLGLGLFISRKGVEANDGLLRLRNFPGRGCIFTIDLPRLSLEVGDKTRERA
jgi:signal transduction histidine kinase